MTIDKVTEVIISSENKLNLAHLMNSFSMEQILMLTKRKIRFAFQIALDNAVCFQKGLLYLNDTLYFRDEKRQWEKWWHADSLDYMGLRRWFDQYYALELSDEEIKRVVTLCVQCNLIPKIMWEDIHPEVINDFLNEFNLTPRMKAVLLNRSTSTQRVSSLKGNSSLLKNRNLRVAMQVILDNLKLFQEEFCFVEGTLRFREIKHGMPAIWHQDMPNYEGLQTWLCEVYGISMNDTELKYLITLCVQYRLIPSMSAKEFIGFEISDYLLTC